MSTTTVTGKLQSILGADVSTGTVEFKLMGFSEFVPRIAATSNLVQQQFTATSDGSGNFSVSVVPNDQIDPAGTFYQVTFKDSTGSRAGFYNFKITGATFDLNSATPMSTPPVVEAPEGDTTYQRLDGGNQPTGNYVPSSASGQTLGTDGARWDAFARNLDVSGTATGLFLAQSANTVLSGPGAGGAAVPTFRALTDADIPALTDADIPDTISLANLTQIAARSHSSLQSIGSDDHHAQSHVLATAAGLGSDHTTSGLTAEQTLQATGATTAAFASLPFALNFVIDGGGSAITTGQKGHVEIPFASTVTGWTILADQSGSIVVDVWKDSYANFPPTGADSIAGSEKPTLSSAQKNQDLTLTTWTTAIATGDILAFNVDSASTVTRVTVSLRMTRP